VRLTRAPRRASRYRYVTSPSASRWPYSLKLTSDVPLRPQTTLVTPVFTVTQLSATNAPGATPSSPTQTAAITPPNVQTSVEHSPASASATATRAANAGQVSAHNEASPTTTQASRAPSSTSWNSHKVSATSPDRSRRAALSE